MSVASTVPDCLTVVPILQLLFISLGPQQLKRINHPLCYLTDQKNIADLKFYSDQKVLIP